MEIVVCHRPIMKFKAGQNLTAYCSIVNHENFRTKVIPIVQSVALQVCSFCWKLYE